MEGVRQKHHSPPFRKALWLQSRAFWASGTWVRRILPRNRFRPALGATSWDPEGPAGPFPACLGPDRLGARARERGSQAARRSEGAQELGSQQTMDPGSQAQIAQIAPIT